jgi:hypothetical protein
VFLGGLVGRPPATLEKRIPINFRRMHSWRMLTTPEKSGDGMLCAKAAALTKKTSTSNGKAMNFIEIPHVKLV